MRALVCAGVLACAVAGGRAQPGNSCGGPAASMSATTFVECARAGTKKYRDHAAAVADGYRRIGRDFPAMGEHWIRMSILFDGKFDPARPEVLNYVVTDGTAVLVGVAYAFPLLAGETVPEGPAGPHAWHDHFRTIHEETALPHHHAPAHEVTGARLAMLHAWIWAQNPDGMFAADNWALPFRRLGRSEPPGTPRAAAMALSLATGGRDYFETSIEAAGANGVDERRIVKHAMDEAQASVLSVLDGLGSAAMSEADGVKLAATWIGMWSRIEAALAPDVRQRLASLPIR